jgi:molecular chaperone GrpE
VKTEEDKEPQVRVVDRRWWARGESTDTAETTSSIKPTYVEDLERRLADTAAQLQSVMTDHRRALDEFDQVRIRMRREVAREVERGKRAVLAELLEVIDNLDRAIAAARETGSPRADAPEAAVDQLARGVELVRDQFLAKLGAFGAARVPALGQPFDALRHEAVTTTPVEDRSQDGTVVAVIKEGYAIGDEILRPASVVVGRFS